MLLILKNRAFVIGLVLVSFFFYSAHSAAAIEAFEFHNEAQEEEFHDLTKVLRCPKCQNQNISDSNASLAKDLRQKTYELVKQGKSYDEIVNYMVARYGNFVRYDPPMTPATIFLWLGPLLFILFGFLVVYLQTRKQKKVPDTLDKNEELRLKKLLKKNKY
jgi:cytochrome c-type biogenesis protein CcmH